MYTQNNTLEKVAHALNLTILAWLKWSFWLGSIIENKSDPGEMIASCISPNHTKNVIIVVVTVGKTLTKPGGPPQCQKI